MSKSGAKSTSLWQKSSFSAGDGCCVELAVIDDMIGMRDSKDPEGAVLYFSRAEIDAFVRGVQSGEFDSFR